MMLRLELSYLVLLLLFYADTKLLVDHETDSSNEEKLFSSSECFLVP